MIELAAPGVETRPAGGSTAIRPPVAEDIQGLPELDLWSGPAHWDLGGARTPAALARPRRVPAVPRLGQRIAKLALISPYDPRGGTVANPLPVSARTIAAVEERGFTVVAPVEGHAPYTHVITTGVHDYLAGFASSRGSRARGKERRWLTIWSRSPGRKLPWAAIPSRAAA